MDKKPLLVGFMKDDREKLKKLMEEYGLSTETAVIRFLVNNAYRELYRNNTVADAQKTGK